MEINQNIAEYYDELYTVSEDQKVFYQKEMSLFHQPVKLLRIGCGTGSFEHTLAKEGADVTGLETSQELLSSANRKSRTQVMSIRYFNMSSLEIGRFLCKGFYNIISILNGRIIFTHDPTLMEKLFYDCHELLSETGHLILNLPNFEKYNFEKPVVLPEQKSIRVSLRTKIIKKDDGICYEYQTIETGNGRILKVTKDAPVYPIKRSEIENFAKKAGFSKIEFYNDFKKAPFSEDSNEIVAVIS